MDKRKLDWASGYYDRGAGDVPGTLVARYRMTDLVNRGFVSAEEGRGLLIDAGLVELAWEVTWSEDYQTFDEELPERFGEVDGYAVFIHGWTGNHSIWESLPGLVVSGNRRLVALSVDHNGFGAARFVDTTPRLEICCPPAAMDVMERLVTILKLRRQPGDIKPRVINFVGHSMGGAALFYLNPIEWRLGEETRYALAPALLLDDDLKRAFFTALGIGIGLVNRIRALEVIERAVKPGVTHALAAGASEFVREQHASQYEATPRGITASTFTAMGLLRNREIARKWDLFRVMLGHRDALVGLTAMVDLLGNMEFPVANLRVVAGTHYMFSVGAESAFLHAQNRELVVKDILELHQKAYNIQQSGALFG